MVFIALEGIDGSGTTTQRQRLGERLGSDGHAVHLTAEPSTGAIGTTIRKILSGDVTMDDASLALMFAADRVDHIEREVAPALAASMIVVTDRYVLSSLAYQSLDLPLSWVQSINERARPADLTVFVRVSPDSAARRRAARGGDVERFDADETQRRIAQAYEQVLSSPLAGEVVVIDGEGAVDEVAEAIWKEVAPRVAK